MAGIVSNVITVQVPAEDEALVGVDVVCALYGRGKSKVWQMVRDGLLPEPAVREPRYTRWKVKDLRAHLKGIGK